MPSIFNAGIRRNQGLELRKEDIVALRDKAEQEAIEAELTEFLGEMKTCSDLFREKAIEAFGKNDRYTCAIYYTLYAISKNSKLEDIYIKDYLMEKVFTPENKVTVNLSLSENQKKDTVDEIFDRGKGFGHSINSLNFKPVENGNIPFEIGSQCISFFDFIGICKKIDIWSDIRHISNGK